MKDSKNKPKGFLRKLVTAIDGDDSAVDPKVVANSVAKAKRDAEKHRIQATHDLAEKMIKDFDLQFVHIRNRVVAEDGVEYVSPFGGLTVAYSTKRHSAAKELYMPRAADKDFIITVATALCNDADNYSKDIGRVNAALCFCAGNVIKLKRPESVKASTFILNTFKSSAYLHQVKPVEQKAEYAPNTAYTPKQHTGAEVKRIDIVGLDQWNKLFDDLGLSGLKFRKL